MCGICGIIDYKGSAAQESLVRKMCSKMTHRGPDEEGVFINNKGSISVSLGHRRLKIIDLSSAARQPMCNEDESIWIVVNGEIYNFLDLRKRLIQEGHIFKSNSDSEVVLHLYEKYAEEFITHINGMFALGIWDCKEQKLILGRDRIGKKPLLYSFVNGVFAFASEFEALLQCGIVPKEINYNALDNYLSLGYINSPDTIYRKVFKLSPGHMLVLKDKSLNIKRYWNLDYSKKIKISIPEAVEQSSLLLVQAVRDRLHSDVPLGVFLSGGIDSSAVTALMSSLLPGKVKTFSIGFGVKRYNELEFAKNIAKHFNTEHHEFVVTPKAMEILPLLVKRYGEPYADSSALPTYYVAKCAKEFVTVALNGDGGDESFVGYLRYLAVYISRHIQNLPAIFGGKLLPELFKWVSAYSSSGVSSDNRIMRFINNAALPISKQYIHYVGIFDQRFKEQLYSQEFKRKLKKHCNDGITVLDKYLLNKDISHLVDRLLYTDVNTYLPGDLLAKMDIATMANSLEVRSPFLDYRLMEFMASIPVDIKFRRGITKYLLRKAMKKVLPVRNINRSKMGFGIPINEWFRNELKPFLIDNLLSPRSLSRGYFNRQSIEVIIRDHISGRKNYGHQLWALLTLELWHKEFMDN